MFLILFTIVSLCMSSTNSFSSIAQTKLLLQNQFFKLSAVQSKNVEIVTDLQRITNSWTLKQYGQNKPYILECIDSTLYDDIISVTVSRVGGLGLDLVELASIPNSKFGLVAVNEIIQGSNADKCGSFCIGDVLISISEPIKPSSTTSPSVSLSDSSISVKTSSVEALNFDSTINELSKYSDYNEVTLKVKRLLKRKLIDIQLYDPQGKFTGMNFTVLAGYGTPLRTILLNNNIKLYDSRTARLDSPYQTGDCGGEGACGTCMVAVLSGGDLLNARYKQEDLALKKMTCPPNYRFGCRAQLGQDSNKGGVLKLKLRPQSVTW